MSVDGNWKITVHTPMGPREAELTVKADGDRFTGRLSGSVGENDIEGQLADSVLTWKSKITNPMPLDLDFSVTVEGDDLAGTVRLGLLGNADVTGKRL